MRGWRGVLTGALGLVALELVLTSQGASGRVSGFFSGISKAVDWLLDNQTPGIPQVKASTDAATSTTSTSSTPGSVLTPPATSTTPPYASINTSAGLTPQQSQEVFAASGGNT